MNECIVRPALGNPAVSCDIAEDSVLGETPVNPSVGWDLSSGCNVTFLGSEDDEFTVTVATSDRDKQDEVTHRSVTREQVVDYAQKLLDLVVPDGAVGRGPVALATDAEDYVMRAAMAAAAAFRREWPNVDLPEKEWRNIASATLSAVGWVPGAVHVPAGQLDDATEMIKQCVGHPDRQEPQVPGHFDLIQQARRERGELRRAIAEYADSCASTGPLAGVDVARRLHEILDEQAGAQ